MSTVEAKPVQGVPVGDRIALTQCRFCKRRMCHYRIYTDDGSFDEIACYQHGVLLEQLADGALQGKPRMNA